MKPGDFLIFTPKPSAFNMGGRRCVLEVLNIGKDCFQYFVHRCMIEDCSSNVVGDYSSSGSIESFKNNYEIEHIVMS